MDLNQTQTQTNKQPEGQPEGPAGGSAQMDLAEYRKLSGAAKRKLKRQKMQGEGAGGRTSTTPSKQPQPGPSRTRNATTTGGDVERGSKRNRSDGSTPKQQSKKSKGIAPALSYKEAFSGAKMAILPEGYPENSLTEEQAGKIKTYLLTKIDEIEEEGTEPRPRFVEVRHNGGLLTITCADPETRQWLEEMHKSCVPWEGAKLDLVEAKDVPKPVRTLAWIPGPPMEPKTILHRLTVQNTGLSTKTWKVVDTKPDPKGQQVIITMDERSWKRIQDLQHRPYLNFSRVTFKELGKKKPGEEKSEEGEEKPPEKMEVEEPQESPPSEQQQ